MVDTEAPSALEERVWRFRSRTRAESEFRVSHQFHDDLVDAFRSGHGLRPDLELVLDSGPSASLVLRARGPSTMRWFSRVLAEIHPPYQWEPVISDGRQRAPLDAGWIARRIHEWPEPLGGSGGVSVLNRWVGVMEASPPGARVRIWFRPLAVPAIHWWVRPPSDVGPAYPPGDRSVRPRVGGRMRLPESPAPGVPLFWKLAVWLEVDPRSPSARSSVDLAAALSAASRTERGNGLEFRQARSPRWGRPVRGRTLIATLEETTSFWPDPTSTVGTEKPTGGDSARVVPLGRTRAGTVVGPPLEVHQGRHLAVLGQTGMGKSSLLVALARRCLGDAGGLVFDPLGDTVRSLRAELGTVDPARCLWISPDASGVQLNALEGIGGSPVDDPIRSERRLNDIVHALRRVRSGRYTESGFWGPRLEEMLTRALRAAAALPDGTLVDAHTLLSTSTRLGRPIPSAAAEGVRELADRIRDRPEDADGARRLLHEVVRSPVLSKLLAAPHPTMTARELVAPGRIVLISGEAARVGESTARYLLSVLLALVWSELLTRASSAKTFVLLDEAQWFSHESLAEMLRLGRRKNVHVVLATQAVASLPDTVAESVWTNVSDFVAFRGSPEEAREFARVAPGVSAEALLSLPRGHAAVLIGKGASVHWVRTVRIPAEGRSPGETAFGGETSRWVGEKGGGTLPADPPEPPPAVPGPAPAELSSELHRMLDELVRLGNRTPPDGPIEVDLSELRRRIDPAGDSVRTLGSLLSRAGALLRVDRGESGRRWVLDRERLNRVRTDRTAAKPVEPTSPPPQPS